LIAIAAAMLLASAAASQTNARLEIAITIDDLPLHAPYPPGVTPDAVSRQMIAALKSGGVPVTGFVNAVRMQEQPGTERVLNAWRAAGAVLGNHGWAHRALSDMSVAEFEQELVKDEPALARHGAGTDWHWFRYPFLDEGKDDAQRIAARKILARHGYRVAAVTAGWSDWAWTPAYARCTAKHNAAGVAELERLYLYAVRQSVADDRETSRKLYGRDIPYVLLMHVSAMSARMMPQLIRIYREAGFRFVSLAEAERDPTYLNYTDLRLPPPPSRAEAAKEKGVKLPAPPEYSAKLNAICA
jgi:peptidoglycan/xylan/chitin deacetylase (PgdA/CDA1 family)